MKGVRTLYHLLYRAVYKCFELVQQHLIRWLAELTDPDMSETIKFHALLSLTQDNKQWPKILSLYLRDTADIHTNYYSQEFGRVTDSSSVSSGAQ